MSSFWDDVGQRLNDGTYTYEELDALCMFLREFDAKNNWISTNYLNGSFNGGYKFDGYIHLMDHVQNKKITKSQLIYIVGNLHSLDHDIDQVMMYTFDKNNPHYWATHVCFSSWQGTFRDGKWKDEFSDGEYM